MNDTIDTIEKVEPIVVTNMIEQGETLNEWHKKYKKCTSCGTYDVEMDECPGDGCRRLFCDTCRWNWIHVRCSFCEAIMYHDRFHIDPCDDAHCDHESCLMISESDITNMVSYPCSCRWASQNDICGYCFDYYTTVLYDKTEEYIEHALAIHRRRQYIQSTKDDRKQELIKALHHLKLKLRDDSVLCNKYINNAKFVGEHNSIDKIVQAMARMRYLYEYTAYREEIQKVRNERKRSRRTFGGPTISISKEARNRILRKTVFPRTWPWLSPNRPRQFRGLVRIIIIFIRMREDYYKPGNKHSQYLKQIDTTNDISARESFNKS